MNWLRTVGLLSIVLMLVAQPGMGQSLPTTVTSASPELVKQLTEGLSITPTQATGGAGTMFRLAKSRLSPTDFSKVAAAVPGMNSFLKAAPPAESTSGFSSLAGSLPGSVGGLASTAGSLQKLGLSPAMAARFVPILTKFVESKGGAAVASLLSGALK